MFLLVCGFKLGIPPLPVEFLVIVAQRLGIVVVKGRIFPCPFLFTSSTTPLVFAGVECFDYFPDAVIFCKLNGLNILLPAEITRSSIGMSFLESGFLRKVRKLLNHDLGCKTFVLASVEGYDARGCVDLPTSRHVPDQNSRVAATICRFR